jgi:hypothetical protein
MSSPDELCDSLAGPFRNINDIDSSGIINILLVFFSALITAGLRFLVLGYCFSRLSPNQAQPIKTPTICMRCQQTGILPTDDALPPSYSESKSSKEALLAKAKSRISQTPSITRFAICITMVIINITAIVLQAYSIQSMIHCGLLSQPSTSADSIQAVSFVTCLWLIFAAGVA